MLGRWIAIGLTLAATPCAAAELHDDGRIGARRSGASVAAYLTLQLESGRRDVKPSAGLRLATGHDYRDLTAPTARAFRSDTLDLRLTGPAPALYLAGRPVSGPEARRLYAGEGGGGRLDTVMIAAAGALAVAAAVVIGTSF